MGGLAGPITPQVMGPKSLFGPLKAELIIEIKLLILHGDRGRRIPLRIGVHAARLRVAHDVLTILAPHRLDHVVPSPIPLRHPNGDHRPAGERQLVGDGEVIRAHAHAVGAREDCGGEVAHGSIVSGAWCGSQSQDHISPQPADASQSLSASQSSGVIESHAAANASLSASRSSIRAFRFSSQLTHSSVSSMGAMRPQPAQQPSW